ncbi:MAG: ATP-binding cassette, subfamily bacterial [Solirubrobacteraceae bacterium]|jgi:ABC-type multidrug transport system fused ATPase/permease subunit|nr:ATP-binding cassette, subfamily bacterial [Solirubrobacteraceae bacterium]
MKTFYRLLGFLRSYKRGLMASWGLASVAMVMTVALPYLTGRAVDALKTGALHTQRHQLAARSHDRHTLMIIAVAIVGAVLLRWALTYMRRMIAGRVSLGIEYDLRELLYGHLQRLELGFFDHQQTGQLMSRATVDLQAVRFFLGYGLVFILQSALTLVLAGVAMILINPKLGLIAMAPVPFVVIISQRYGRRARPAIQEVQQRIAELTASAEENISGVRVVKSFAREPLQLERFRHSVARVFDQAMVSTRLEARYNPMIGFLPQLGLAAVLLIGGTSVIHAHLSLGQFTAFYFYLAMLISPMRSLGVTLGLAQRATASGARIFQLLDREPRLSSPPDAPPLPPGNGRVELRGVTLRYDDADDFGAAYRADDGRQADEAHAALTAAPPAASNGGARTNGGSASPSSTTDLGSNGARPGAAMPAGSSARAVLRDVDLDVPAGRTIALVGATGSGKTSLVSLISRLYDASAGRVLIDGADVREVELESLRHAVAIVSDDPFLFSATVAENIAYARPGASPAEIEQAARRAQAHEFIAELPQGYGTRVGERGLTLSGGQRQRLAIARALLADPRVLILDDATSSVDSSTERLIKLALDEAMAGRTTFIIAHRLSTIALADEIVVLDHGRVLDHGDHAELLESSELYREIVAKGLPDQVFLTRETREREVSGL